MNNFTAKFYHKLQFVVDCNTKLGQNITLDTALQILYFISTQITLND